MGKFQNYKEIIIKGAPDRIIDMCSSFCIEETENELDEHKKHDILKDLSSRSERGFRLIGFIKKIVSFSVIPFSYIAEINKATSTSDKELSTMSFIISSRIAQTSGVFSSTSRAAPLML